MKDKITQLQSTLAGLTLLFALFPAAQASETWGSDDLNSFIKGATIMAAGGGGSPTIAFQLLNKYFTDADTVQVNNVADIPKEQGYSAASVGAIGSPAELFSLTDPLGLPLNAYIGLDLVFEHYEAPISYIMPIEVGAINGIFAFLATNTLNNESSTLSISVLNVDGGGRSVPTLPLLLYSQYPNVYDQSAVVTSPTSVIMRVPPGPSEWAILNAPGGNQERIESAILAMLSGTDSPYKGAAGYGSFYIKADDISGNPPVLGQLSVARDAGVAYGKSPTGESVANSLTGSGRHTQLIFSGAVTDITLDTQGLDLGVVTVSGSGNYDGDTFTIQYENENICAYKESYSTATPFVLGPDSIGYVPLDGTVFDNSDLYEQFKKGAKPKVDIIAVLASSQITQIPNIMDAWQEVRAAIPDGKCDFEYKTPWSSK